MNRNTTIRKATVSDAEMLSVLGLQTLIESHGHSAPKEDIDYYVAKTYPPSVLQKELSDPANTYHILYYQDLPVGYSKILLNKTHPAIISPAVTKLDRIYILKNYIEFKLGTTLFDFNMDIIRQQHQTGVWLYTWVDNIRAVKFYTKKGFKPIAAYNFKVSETHSNPNHLMYLEL